jgi:XRE family aerobic/anaerobic benzoate catabolism transcriptional regulator
MHYISRMPGSIRGRPVPERAPRCGAGLLAALSRQVRRRRHDQGLSRAELAGRSGLSVRFLARVEGGDGNISVVRLAALAQALGTTPDELLRPEPEPSRIVVLVGLRGAGKSTVGPLLAHRLGWPFVEMDDLITEASGLSLEQLFELHGERYYRRLERETLRRVLATGGPVVLAAAGGVVSEPTSWRLLREAATTVWLRARPEEHWSRVVAQGDRRPMADNPAAMEELRALLSARASSYAQARWTLETSGRAPDAVAEQIVRRLRP